MAQIVAGIGVPHGPSFPARVRREGPDCDVAALYREVMKHVEPTRPDVLVVFANDHFNTFFFDNFPTFAIGVAEASSGPRDQTDMPVLDVTVHARLAEHVRRQAIADGFDLSLTQDFGLDHAFMVPLFFLNDGMRLPVVPIWVNAFVPPLPSSRRAYALGRSVRAAIEAWPEKMRVAAVGTGNFSLEIGGPRAEPGGRSSVPDPDWVTRVSERLASAEIDELVAEATGARMRQAGNVGGELLNFIAMLGAIGNHRPSFIETQPEEGHVFAAWALERA
jgi:Catalytic LigB subunit of aromatic ring-opening dioxygenase